MSVNTARVVPADAQVLGVPVFADRRVPPSSLVELDRDYLGERGFEGKVDEACALPADDGTTVVAVGLGDRARVDADVLRRAAAAFVKAAWHDTTAALALLDALPTGVDRARAAQAVAEGAVLAAYRFGKYKTATKPCRLQNMTVVAAGAARSVTLAAQRGARIAEAVCLARDLINEPAGAMTPRRLAEVASEVAERSGLGITVLDEVAIAAEGLGGLAGVARGSAEPPRLIRLAYEPRDARGSVALVGKGITFDSGGLSLKTTEGMQTMKHDMAGGAAVLAAMSVLPALAAPVRVVAFIPATENMPSGTATRPGDVLKARNGKTIEVLDTDAEGRLVLADGLSMAAEEDVGAIIDVATLTGAVIVALGDRVSGLFGNHPGWVDQVRAAADRVGEAVWPMPLPEVYRKRLDSEVADLRNVGRSRWGGALTAGLFLREFVGEVPWAHLDIAGPAWAEEADGYDPKGATGFGVRTLIEAIMTYRAPKPARLPSRR